MFTVPAMLTTKSGAHCFAACLPVKLVLQLLPASILIQTTRHAVNLLPFCCRILEATSEADRSVLLSFLTKLLLYLPPASLTTGPRGSSLGGPMGLAMQQMGLPTALGPGPGIRYAIAHVIVEFSALSRLALYMPPASLTTGPRGRSIGGPVGLAMQQMGLPTALGPGPGIRWELLTACLQLCSVCSFAASACLDVNAEET